MIRRKDVKRIDEPIGGGEGGSTKRRGIPLKELDERGKCVRKLRADRYWDLHPHGKYPDKYLETGLAEDLPEEVRDLLKKDKEHFEKYGTRLIQPHKYDGVM